MRILLYTKWGEEGGGSAIYGRTLAHELVKRGHEVCVCTVGDSRAIPKSQDSFKISVIPSFFRNSYYAVTPFFRARSYFERLLTGFRPDIVHASIAVSDLDFFVGNLCRKFSVPVVHTYHNPFSQDGGFRSFLYNFPNFIYGPYLRRHAKKLVVFSDIQKQFLKKRFSVPEECCSIIPNAVDTTFYSPGFSRFRQQFKEDVFILYSGRLAAEKNVEALLRAFFSLKNIHAKSRLIVMGDGHLKRYLTEKYKDEKVTFTGHISDVDEKLDIMRSAQVFVMPSFVEGLSLSLLESMSLGHAIIATKVGGHEEALKDCGIVLNVSEIGKKLPTMLQMLVDNRSFRLELGQKAREKALLHYSLAKNIDLLLHVYYEALESNA